MVYYTEETPRVNKRMVAGYYLFLCLIGFAILLGPTGSGITITNVFSDRVRDAHELATPNLEDGTSCLDGGCHSTTWNYWNMTTHSGYLVYWNETGDGMVTVNGHRARTYLEFNASCAQCHAIGWTAERNVTDWPNTHDGFGTNCFSCHSDVAPYYSVNGSSCASCHIHEDEHGNCAGYPESAHANSLTDLRASGHAGSDCMHCMSVEGFLDQEAELDPEGDYNPITCPACHSVHDANIENPAMIRAVNSTELCGLCHGHSSRHTTIEVWVGGPHYMTGIVECVDCHGFEQGSHGSITNHSFYVNPEDSCGQSAECHEGQEAWAIAQMEEITTAFDELVEDFGDEADAFETVVLAYNATAGANQTLVNYLIGEIADASDVVAYYTYDSSSGFHSPMQTFDDINSAFRDLLNAEAYYYENLPAPATGVGFSADTLIIVAGAAGGIVVGLLLGVLVGRRR
jgi:hypothetical protein